ncbi:JmjC domain hydroxylase [Nitzschia inconspicua]|uniref:JmjC domain hydroxylase n=2 Tax=Nitzschia inconspicua TaxID=303405 RepID=A0A9K3K722_9STRA|nr:JmjC domain hydroxylase [Nitzschia inconspicua]
MSSRDLLHRFVKLKRYYDYCNVERSANVGFHRSDTRMCSASTNMSVDEHFMTPDGTGFSDVHNNLATFLQPYYRDQRPVVIRGAVQMAPATKRWTSWEYWQQAFAESNTMVAVEMGGSYGSEQSERVEIPILGYLQYLEMFEERHGRIGKASWNDSNVPSDQKTLSSWSIPSSELVYMAQNDLPQQLHNDIFIPNFCQIDNSFEGDGLGDSSSSLGLGRLYSIMLWMGPRGCVSPLHFDPLDNCLMQHVGRKRVLLYEPTSSTSGWHYAGCDGQQTNTSPINPEVMDGNDTNSDQLQQVKTQYPLFLEEAPPRKECILNPGDLLYIPAKWWHHVRSIDTSASVNVWWR